MKLQRITPDQFECMPWKIGGGTTRQIAIAPEGAGLTDFDWRVSSAIVASSGPFSAFPGIDRSLAVMSGGSLRLDIEGTRSLSLGENDPPLEFSGEQAIDCQLVAPDSVIDFNVMTRRGRWCQKLERVQLSRREFFRAHVVLVYCLTGKFDADVSDLLTHEFIGPGEVLLMQAEKETALELVTLDDAPATLLVVRLDPARNQRGASPRSGARK